MWGQRERQTERERGGESLMEGEEDGEEEGGARLRREERGSWLRE